MYILSVVSFETMLLVSGCSIFILLLMLIRKVSTKNIIVLLLCVLMFCAGGIRYESSNNIKGKTLYNFKDEIVTVQGTVIEKPVVTDKTISFIGRMNNVCKNGKNTDCDEKVRFSYFINENDDITKLLIPSYGDVFYLDGKIDIPNGAMNSGGFDYSRYLKGENIFFQCVFSLEDFEVTSKKENRFFDSLYNFRQKCISFYDEAFPYETGAVLKAFVLGDKSSLDYETEEIFSGSGLSHILAVSGLHVSTFAIAFCSLITLFSRSKRKQMLASTLASIFFVLFTGASVSAIRAGVMCAAAFFAKLIYRRADSLSVLSEIAAIFCVINPHVIYDASFILSFAATASIIVFNDSVLIIFKPLLEKLDKEKTWHRKAIKLINVTSVSISAQIFIIPLLIYLFNGFSVMSVAATVVIAPFLLPLLTGGLVFCAMSFVNELFAVPAAVLIYLLAKIIIFVAEFFSAFWFSKIAFGIVTPFFLLLYALVIATIIYAIKRKRLHFITSLVCVTCLLVLYLINSIINYDVAQVSFINVGNGDCALIKSPGDCDILIDAGASSKSETSGRYIIYPYLIKNGVNDIEYVVLSHTHSDHVNGLLGLFDIMEIGNIIMPYNAEDTDEAKKILEKAHEYNIPVTYFASGDILKISDDIKITAITPDIKQLLISKNKNDSCLTVRLDYGKTSFLFTGDITSDIENYILDNYPDMLEADVLKVAHHGSQTSTCQRFVDAVKPKYSYIPVGKNSYGHPSEEVIDRLEKNGSEVYRASYHRDVTFFFDAEKITGVKYKAVD